MADDLDMSMLYHVIWGRYRVQYEALELVGLIRRITGSGLEPLVLEKYEILAAVTFSLWRAIFLAEGERDLVSVATDADTFLQRLLRHNAITYMDDWNNRNWSFLYYIENARGRLRQLAGIWPEFQARLGSPAWLQGPPNGATAMAFGQSMQLWNDLCGGLQVAVWTLDELTRGEGR